MFSGIVQAVGTVMALTPRGGDLRLEIDSAGLPASGLNLGASVAVNGCCLTVADLQVRRFAADASRETLALTTLGSLAAGAPVNLETPLTLSTPLGGHLVLGHVDGVATVRGRQADARSVRFEIEVPADLSRYIARKGSVCVDGVSLTVNAVQHAVFSVNIIPHTLEHTILHGWQIGTRVNVEVDLLARYLERLLQRGTADGALS